MCYACSLRMSKAREAAPLNAASGSDTSESSLFGLGRLIAEQGGGTWYRPFSSQLREEGVVRVPLQEADISSWFALDSSTGASAAGAFQPAFSAFEDYRWTDLQWPAAMADRWQDALF